ncbi:MAG TPA: tetratricopeptide repeat protein [Terriglobia bacterium]|nr:tetratricopeptide repeat protein [Terriglobia bacterium]
MPHRSFIYGMILVAAVSLQAARLPPARVALDLQNVQAAASSASSSNHSTIAARQAGAIARLRARLDARPDDVQTMATLAGLYMNVGNLAKAELLLAKAAKLDPGSSTIRLNWAAALARLHRYPEAEAALKGIRAPSTPASRIEYWRIKASIALGLGNRRVAARDMEEALAVDPQNPGLRLATGLAETEAGRWNTAIQTLAPVFDSTHDPSAGLALLRAQTAAHQDASRTLAELDGLSFPPAQDVAFRVEMGRILVQAGMEGQAASEFQRAARESPLRADLFYDLALAQFDAGQIGAALASAQRAKSSADSGAVESLLGDIDEKRGDSLAAVHSYQAAVRLEPGNEQYYMALGLELLRHQTYKPAAAVFRDAAQRFPRSARARIALGVTDYLLEEYSAAAKDLMAAGRLGKDPVMAYQYLGETQLEQPPAPDVAAVTQLCNFSDAHPWNSHLSGYCGALLARSEHEQGNPAPSQDAMRRLEAAARLNPNDAIARCELGKAYEEMKQWQPARESLEVCARLTPDSAEVHYRLARVCQALRDGPCAKQQTQLHDEAVKKVVTQNAAHDRTLRKFLYTMKNYASQ